MFLVVQIYDNQYSIRLLVAPKEDLKEIFVHFRSLPTFEHREDITVVTDEYSESVEEAKLPNSVSISKRRSTSVGNLGTLTRAPTGQTTRSLKAPSIASGYGSLYSGTGSRVSRHSEPVQFEPQGTIFK